MTPPSGKPGARAATGPNKTPTATDKTAIGLLRTVYSRLEKAEADYRGHRLRAMEHVSAALLHLGAVSPSVPALTISAINLPQAQSDQVFRDAIHTLSRTELMLDTSAPGSCPPPRRTSLGCRGDSPVAHGIGNPLIARCVGHFQSRQSGRMDVDR